MELTAPDSFVYPASYFVFAFLGLLTLIAMVALWLSRRSGDLDNEEIKYKVFDDGIPNPRTEPEYEFRRRRSVASSPRNGDREQ
jgi:hypothetical protein